MLWESEKNKGDGMEQYVSIENIEANKFVDCTSEYRKAWNDAVDTIIDNAPRADVIPVEWIIEWARKRPFVYDDRTISKMLQTWRAESAVFPEKEKKSTYIFADDLAKVGNDPVNQKEGSN